MYALPLAMQRGNQAKEISKRPQFIVFAFRNGFFVLMNLIMSGVQSGIYSVV